jgi:hypothetical protein
VHKNIYGLSFALTTLALFGGVTAASGCGDSAAALCDDICNCQRCTSNDIDTCRSQADAAEQSASSAGCSSQFDDLVACTKKNISCQGDKAVAKGCDAEEQAFAKCGKGVVFPTVDQCTLAVNHLNACLGGTSTGSGGATPSCTGATLCNADCFNAADCAAIKDAVGGMPTDLSKPLLDCVTKCANAPNGG